MNTLTDIEKRRKRIETLAKVGGLAVAGFLFAPFALATIQGVVSLVVISAVGLVTVNVGLPWFGVTVANWRLKALKAAAAANPIETLENQYADRQAALLSIRDNIKKSYSVLQNLYAQIQEHNSKFPGSPSQYLDKYSKLKSLIELRGAKYKQAQANLAQFSDLIDEKRSDWEIAKTMAEASKLADVGEDFTSKLLNDSALKTVQDGLNLAFSELDMSLLDEKHDGQPPAAAQVGAPKRTLVLAAPASPLDLGFDAGAVDAELVPASKTRKTTH